MGLLRRAGDALAGADAAARGLLSRAAPTTVLAGGAVVVLLLLGLNALALRGDADGSADRQPSVMADASTPGPGAPATAPLVPRATTVAPDPGTAATEATPPPAGGATADAGTPSTAGPVPAPAGSDVQAALPVGTCLTVPSRPTDVASVSPIDCAQPHNGEVFISVVLTQGPGAPYPGEDALRQDSRSLCQGRAFEDYVGAAYTDTQLFAFPLFPTEETWAAGDRDVSCFLADITGPAVGSARGSGGAGAGPTTDPSEG